MRYITNGHPNDWRYTVRFANVSLDQRLQLTAAPVDMSSYAVRLGGYRAQRHKVRLVTLVQSREVRMARRFELLDVGEERDSPIRNTGGRVRTTRNRLALSGVLVLLAACAPGARKGAAIVPAQEVYVTVENQNFLDVSIYALRGSSRMRIGQVTGNGSASLKVPSSVIVAGQIRLLADAIGSSERFLTDVINVDPDQGVQLTLAPAMRMSSYSLYRR